MIALPMSVATNPGATALTAIPLGARASARDWVSELSPAFAAPYAGYRGSPRKAPRDDTLTIRPPWPRCRAAHQHTLAGPSRLAARVRCHAACHPS